VTHAGDIDDGPGAQLDSPVSFGTGRRRLHQPPHSFSAIVRFHRRFFCWMGGSRQAQVVDL
jgi:hypothetical protein